MSERFQFYRISKNYIGTHLSFAWHRFIVVTHSNCYLIPWFSWWRHLLVQATMRSSYYPSSVYNRSTASTTWCEKPDLPWVTKIEIHYLIWNFCRYGRSWDFDELPMFDGILATDDSARRRVDYIVESRGIIIIIDCFLATISETKCIFYWSETFVIATTAVKVF